jgi:hypothetical protein
MSLLHSRAVVNVFTVTLSIFKLIGSHTRKLSIEKVKYDKNETNMVCKTLKQHTKNPTKTNKKNIYQYI